MNFLNPFAPQSRAILRIVTGLLFMSVGIAKLFHFPAVPMFANIHITDMPLGLAGMIELVGGAMVMVGLFSRFAAFICSGEMAAAYFMAHWAIVTATPHSPYPVVNGGEGAILFCFIFLYFACSGPGIWAVNQK